MVIIRCILLFSFVLFSCKARKCQHDSIKVNNNSSAAIYIIGDPHYPDSNLSIRYKSGSLINDSSRKKISPHQSGLLFGHQCAEDIFDKDNNSKMMLFIFDANTIENTPWSQVVSNNLYIKRYDLSYNDMNSMGWEINYP